LSTDFAEKVREVIKIEMLSGKQVKEILKSQGRTQVWLSKMIGMQQSNLSAWLNSKGDKSISQSKIHRIYQVLDL
jgi:transcriptional regulator with XRE-family HTH domain